MDRLGTYPAWASSLGTFLVFFLGYRVYAKDRESVRQEQAAKIACWVVEDDDMFRLLLRNASDLPVFRVTVQMIRPSGNVETHGWPYGVLPPATDRVPQQSDDRVSEVLTAFFEAVRERHPDYLHPTQAGVQLSFVDNAQRGWRRQADGRLREMSKRELKEYAGTTLGPYIPHVQG